MPETYRLLQVRAVGDDVFAVVPVADLRAAPAAADVRADFQTLEQCPAKRVRLDAGQVLTVDGTFMAALIRLWKALHARAVPFAVLASTPLAELMTITKLDKLFPVTEVPTADTPLVVYAASK